jgi:hypothetical protein
MVGRFNVRPDDGDSEWLVWDNAVNGHRGRCQTEDEANALAADLELQYDVHGPRDQANVRRVTPPVPVDVWQRAGVLDAWVREQGCWVGRVRMPDGRTAWIDQAELRAAPAENLRQGRAGGRRSE